MDSQQFLVEFGHVANAPEGVTRLRALVLSLAFSGRLCATSVESVESLIESIEGQRAAAKVETRNQRLARERTQRTTEGGYFAIPDGWRWISLSTVGHTWGQKKPSKDFYYIDVSSIENKAGVLSPVLEVVPASAAPSRARKIVKKGTLIYSTVRPYLLNVAAVDRDFDRELIASTAFAVVHPWSGIEARYLYYYLRSPHFVRYVESVQIGMAYPAISDDKFYSGLVPIAPTEEQSRIVAKIDELMALCDQLERQQQDRRKLQNAVRQSTLHALAIAQSPHELKTSWQRLQASFGRVFSEPADTTDLDQTIKQLALKGLLTAARSGEQVSDYLIDMADSSVDVNSADWPIPSHWIWARCAWLGEARLGKMLDASKNKGELCPYLRNINVRWRRFDLSEVLKMRVEEHELQRVSVRRGDLVICEGGEPGRAAIWNSDEEFVIQKALHRFRCGPDVLPEYMLFCLEHDYFSGRLARYYTGATIKHLTGKALAEYSVPLPPIAEQRRILEAAGAMSSVVAKLRDQLLTARRCGELYAAAAVSALTGIAIEQDEDAAVKAPQTELIAPLRLATPPDVKAQAPLATILARHQGEMAARDLWQRFGGEIDAFYSQLKIEVAHGWIAEPEVAQVREKPTAETVEI